MCALPGKPRPLGVTLVEGGANFALYSAHAKAVEVCLYDSPEGRLPTRVSRLPGRTEGVFHGWLPGVRAGQSYGYRVRGPWDPASGHRFDPFKVLLDPYARAIARSPRWGPESYSYRAEEHPDPAVLGQQPSYLSNAASSPLGLVTEVGGCTFQHPRRSWSETVVYELHVRGFTKRHPAVDAGVRGTYAGLASDAAVRHIASLGVTAVELMPVQHHADEHRLQRLGLTNYWGYQPLGFFAPEPSYAASTGVAVIDEFRAMVRRLHAEGIEVILDVVFNHTAELGHDGPTLSFRGIDNCSYYRLDPADRRQYLDHTGCGNSLNAAHPAVARLVLDSLRHWVTEMGVDGFRFDLAPSLGRCGDSFDPRAPLLAAIRSDPVLEGTKLIAEPWDLHASDGFQLGRFPSGWLEWNGKFRDDVRRYWRGGPGTSGAFATRLAGSSDIFSGGGRSPLASLNFVTCHDGFTMVDLVSYDRKHNATNGEGGLDGEGENHSWNCGEEGPSLDPAVLALRERQRRNLMATLLLSQGVPMILAGDELGRTQMGNNNAYCQDNEISWLNWEVGGRMDAFVRRLISLRKGEHSFRRAHFFSGRIDPSTGRKDITWLSSEGRQLVAGDWEREEAGAFGAWICEPGRPCYLLLFNNSETPRQFELPDGKWCVEVDTARTDTESAGPVAIRWFLGAASLALLRLLDEE